MGSSHEGCAHGAGVGRAPECAVAHGSTQMLQDARQVEIRRDGAPARSKPTSEDIAMEAVPAVQARSLDTGDLGARTWSTQTLQGTRVAKARGGLRAA